MKTHIAGVFCLLSFFTNPQELLHFIRANQLGVRIQKMDKRFALEGKCKHTRWRIVEAIHKADAK